MPFIFSNAFLSDTNREFAKSLLENAFPAEERPTFETMEQRDDKYRLCVVQKDGKNVGIVGYWSFDDVVYIEHLAIDKALRNMGLGTEMLKTFFSGLDDSKQVVVEVELPKTKDARRRIAFYERLGFCCSEYSYQQPPYHSNYGFLPMLLMSLLPLSEQDFRRIKDVLYKKVYGVTC